MDRYKFRGKRLDTGEWVEGNYQAGKGIHPHVISWWIVHQFEGDVSDEIDVAEVDPTTVGQYSTLNDSKQNELYDGDIAKHVTAGWTGVISFKDGAYRFSNGFGTWDLLRSRADKLVKVGNIHDNPELVEVQRETT